MSRVFFSFFSAFFSLHLCSSGRFDLTSLYVNKNQPCVYVRVTTHACACSFRQKPHLFYFFRN
uniref:Secreted protein n=1 Tax=Oryza brachyantha TaxID=4533 RepID=J3LUE0_ORYBR